MTEVRTQAEHDAPQSPGELMARLEKDAAQLNAIFPDRVALSTYALRHILRLEQILGSFLNGERHGWQTNMPDSEILDVSVPASVIREAMDSISFHGAERTKVDTRPPASIE